MTIRHKLYSCLLIAVVYRNSNRCEKYFQLALNPRRGAARRVSGQSLRRPTDATCLWARPCTKDKDKDKDTDMRSARPEHGMFTTMALYYFEQDE